MADTSTARVGIELVQEGAQEALMAAIKAFPRRVLLLRQANEALRNLVRSSALSTDFIDLHLGEKLLTLAIADEQRERQAAALRVPED
eukprot:4906675-Prymnesium_polylepis.1